jgi:hypothetical protein
VLVDADEHPGNAGAVARMSGRPATG